MIISRQRKKMNMKTKKEEKEKKKWTCINFNRIDHYRQFKVLNANTV